MRQDLGHRRREALLRNLRGPFHEQDNVVPSDLRPDAVSNCFVFHCPLSHLVGVDKPGLGRSIPSMNRDEIRVARAGASLIVAHMIGRRPVGVRRNVGERDPLQEQQDVAVKRLPKEIGTEKLADFRLRQGLRRERPAV